ncbi:PREDICTED: uncharacterized protein LOC109470798 isoform X2 [Branchiostoma belcheri]|uniref:Uncharacterized protein LOC109470798 isoform X2 n=1 Tax=Branchiostoma belcheri TaxID=7741 RepID=A0A6P4Z742_BRABE|nr:PREDICTED: uncharacterized protein LOC109470798 isoform X2 [Branchiostoma belcheri]
MATPTMDADEVETFSDCSFTVECICEEFESDSDSEEVVGVLMPYRFEPYLSDVQSDEPNSDSDDEGEAAGDAMADGGELEIDGQIPLDSESRLRNMDCWKRYTTYRQFVRWCYEFLGKKNRVTLPSCTVDAIRSHFPSPDYTGFREADD